MASRVEDDLQCPSCLDIFKDPVMLLCCHSFCRECVQRWWKQKGDRTCPICRKRCRSMKPPSNLALRNVCETVSQAAVEAQESCSLHKEKLKLFCLDHQELVCLICRDAEIHAGHKFRPLHEVVEGHKQTLQEGLQGAKERLKNYNEIRNNCNEQSTHINVQGKQVESKIRKDFEELRRFLQVEEEARLSAVWEEEQKKSFRMNEKIEALSRDIATLSDAIRTTEKQLTSGPVSFMQNFKTVMTIIQKLPAKPELLPGALLDEAKHVGNLKFNVWERIKEMVSYSPVILDPNTACPELSLSEDLTSVSFQKRQQRPKNPERFKRNIVFGCALASGTHTWDVEVGDNTSWKVGMMWEDPCLPDSMKVCGIGFRGGEYKMLNNQFESCVLPVKLQRIRVHVNTNERSVSLFDCLTNTELGRTKCQWPHFSDNMNFFPFFATKGKIPLQIISLAPRVTTQSQ